MSSPHAMTPRHTIWAGRSILCTTPVTIAPTSSWRSCSVAGNSWEDDALVVDKAGGLFAHPDKVHRRKFNGRYLQSSGTFTVPRSPQGLPVVIQAGSFARGKEFSARWA